MRRNYIREKKILCGDSYMAVGLYAITPQEHKARGKKQKESSTCLLYTCDAADE